MKRCLVTGIAGFIGSSIAEALVCRGFEVRGIDNLSTGDLRNLGMLGSQIEFTHGDIRDKALMESLCRDVDIVFHQAAIASVQCSLDDPLGTWDVNVNGTANVIAASIKAGVRRVIFASSSAVYGDAHNLPSQEIDRLNPLSPYAAHKLNGELMLRDAWLDGHLEPVSLRYFNVFGPRQSADSPYSGAIASFAKTMLREGGRGPVRIFGDGSHTRDFVYIADVVQANLAAMDASVERASGSAFNIGSGTGHSVLQTARTLAHLTGYEGLIVHEPARPGEVPHSLADIRQACNQMGYKPAISFTRGLAETIAWMYASAYVSLPSAIVVNTAPFSIHTVADPRQAEPLF